MESTWQINVAVIVEELLDIVNCHINLSLLIRVPSFDQQLKLKTENVEYWCLLEYHVVGGLFFDWIIKYSVGLVTVSSC